MTDGLTCQRERRGADGQETQSGPSQSSEIIGVFYLFPNRNRVAEALCSLQPILFHGVIDSEMT